MAESPTWRSGLSDRELAIQRWFSWITFQTDRQQSPWPHWYCDNDQLGTTSLRYQLAFAGYGCTAMAAQTPAYHEIGQKQLDDICRRLIDVRTWQYITRYWRYGENPPDPCLYDNVMYTGHLTQLMCFYELLTGDLRYSESGWDFTWQDGRKLHYTLGKAIERLYDLSKASANGGICCEPGLIFIVCNNHSALSFSIFDLIHGGHHADANLRWFDWMTKNGRNKMSNTADFLYGVYHRRTKIWVPMGDFGNDGWALGWGYPWFADNDFAQEGWSYIKKHAQWVSPRPDEIYAKGSALVGCCANGTSPMRNAFLPLLAVQVEGAASPTARKILRWFDAEYGRAVDTDGDGVNDAYYYHTDDSLYIPATGNIAAALATDGPSLQQFVHTWKPERFEDPTLTHVDYPKVYVRSAEFIAPVLRFTVLKGTPGFQGKTELICDHITSKFHLTRDGRPYDDFRKTNSMLIIATDVDQEHVFELTIGSHL
jgi:hypothetical protein